MKLQEMHKLPKHKANINSIILIIPSIIVLLIIVADIILYAQDIMLTPYIIIFLTLIISIFKNHNNRILKVNYFIAAISLISFIYLKPNYTISQATQTLKKNSVEAIKIDQLGYVNRKNILVRGAYVFSARDNKLIIFDNINGEFNIVNN